MEYIKLALLIWASGWIVCLLLQFLHRRSVSRKLAKVQAEQARIAEDARRRANEAREQAQRMAEIQREQMRQAQEQARAERERQRMEREQARQAEQIAKHEKRISDLEYKVSQAEKAMLDEQDRMDFHTEERADLVKQIKKLDRDIEYNRLANKVDAEAKAQAEQKKLRKKLFGVEEKIRACENRMEKSRRLIETAQREIDAA